VTGTGQGGHTATGTGGLTGGGQGGVTGGGLGGATGGGLGGVTGGGTGGVTGGGTGGVTGGATGGTPGRSCPVASPDVISDFEEGFGVMVKQGGRTGYWATYNDSADPQNQTPAKPPVAMSDQIAVEPSGACMMSAFHSSASQQTHYVGFGAQFHPNMPDTTSNVGDPYDVSQWDGITFRAKTGGGPASQPVFVEILTKETQPSTAGGTATVQAIDLYNNRGFIANVGSATYQQFYIPFGAMIPRSLPEASTCGAMTSGGPKCQAPRFVPTDALAIQFSFYGMADTPGLPRPTTVGSYNMFIDDVAFYHRSASTPDLPALPSNGGAHPITAAGNLNARCKAPMGANGLLLAQAYANWKSKFVVADSGGFKVIRPENGNDTVSEGIGYGMLIAVYMDDKPLFDGLYTYWKAHIATNGLMTWCIPAGSGSCSASGGTATDADGDAAFAMLMASKQWTGGTYAADATTLMHGVLAADMSGTYIKAGSNYSATGITNPSYFSPAWYRAFSRADTANSSAWTGLANGAFTLLNAISGSSSNGLYPAWCQNNCASPASNGASTDMIYQYDSHRIPWRMGTDYCWNGTAAAKTYVDKTSAFFSSPSHGGGGVGRLVDLYNLDGTDYTTGQARNSASIIGTSAVGAMASAGTNTAYATYLNDAYQFVLDISNRGTINDRAASEITPATKTSYSYFNGTVGMLTLLTMTGNLQDWTQ
jgi:endo-1,4-beta-D-glucanase Y